MNTLSIYYKCHKIGWKLNFSEQFNFPWNQLDAIVFVFFTCRTQNQSRIIKWPAVEQQDQDKVRHVWSIGVISFVLKEIQMWTKVIRKKHPNNVDFPEVIFNFSNKNNVFFSLHIMHGWRAMDWNWGTHSVSVQCYEFCLDATLFM